MLTRWPIVRNGRDEQDEVEREQRERADVISPASTRCAAVPEHDEESDQRQRLERRQEHGVDVGDVECRLHDLVRLAAEARGERRPGAEALDDADARDRLLDERGRSPSCSWFTFVRSA